MGPGLGTILRRLGYLIEVPCLLGVLQVRARVPRAPAGALEMALYAGVVVGIGFIIAGNLVNARSRRKKDRWYSP
jgi:hypothetical protein